MSSSPPQLSKFKPSAQSASQCSSQSCWNYQLCLFQEIQKDYSFSIPKHSGHQFTCWKVCIKLFRWWGIYVSLFHGLQFWLWLTVVSTSLITSDDAIQETVTLSLISLIGPSIQCSLYITQRSELWKNWWDQHFSFCGKDIASFSHSPIFPSTWHSANSYNFICDGCCMFIIMKIIKYIVNTLRTVKEENAFFTSWISFFVHQKRSCKEIKLQKKKSVLILSICHNI